MDTLSPTAPTTDELSHPPSVVGESAAPAARADIQPDVSQTPAAALLSAQPPAVREHKSLTLAMLAAQRDAKEIVKDARNEGGPNQQAYDYATLPNVYEQARSVINAHGLVLFHEPRVREIAGEVWSVMETHLTHAKTDKAKSAEYLLCRGWLPPKQIGALMSYAERYNTLALLALAPKERDTDGGGAGRPASHERIGATADSLAPPSNDRLMMIDGSGLIYRAFHACPKLVRESDGQPVGAVIGFVGMVSKLVSSAPAHAHIVVVFDAGKRTFRHTIYAGYKANREATPDDLAKQMPLFRDAARALGLATVEMAGFEADDLIATYARRAVGEGASVTIVSGDKDLMQLVAPSVQLFDPTTSSYITSADVVAKLGAPPHRAIDAQALIGDTADNIPGAPGIGPVWAGDLLAKFGTVEALIARQDEIEDLTKRQIIQTHATQILLSKQLVTLLDAVPVTEGWRTFSRGEADVSAFLESMGPNSEHTPAPPATKRAEEGGDPVYYADMLKRLARCKSVKALDAWLTLCTSDALKRCTATQRDSLRAEHLRKRTAMTTPATAGAAS